MRSEKSVDLPGGRSPIVTNALLVWSRAPTSASYGRAAAFTSPAEVVIGSVDTNACTLMSCHAPSEVLVTMPCSRSVPELRDRRG